MAYFSHHRHKTFCLPSHIRLFTCQHHNILLSWQVLLHYKEIYIILKQNYLDSALNDVLAACRTATLWPIIQSPVTLWKCVRRFVQALELALPRTLQLDQNWFFSNPKRVIIHRSSLNWRYIIWYANSYHTYIYIYMYTHYTEYMMFTFLVT